LIEAINLDKELNRIEKAHLTKKFVLAIKHLPYTCRERPVHVEL